MWPYQRHCSVALPATGVLEPLPVAATASASLTRMAVGDVATYACEGNDFVPLAGRMFATIYAWVPTAAGIIVVLFAALHRLLLRVRRRTYGGACLEQQLVTATHALYTVLFAIQIVPQTILVCHILFTGDFIQRCALGGGITPCLLRLQHARGLYCTSEGGPFDGSRFPHPSSSLLRWYQGAFAILDSHLVLYAFEGALRAVARPSWLLLLHHTCFFAITATGFFARSFFVLKARGCSWHWLAQAVAALEYCKQQWRAAQGRQIRTAAAC